jgi:hypothetical protein
MSPWDSVARESALLDLRRGLSAKQKKLNNFFDGVK